jgi:hypothetical protein
MAWDEGELGSMRMHDLLSVRVSVDQDFSMSLKAARCTPVADTWVGPTASAWKIAPNCIAYTGSIAVDEQT